MCEEGIAETAGRPDGDGIIGMSRLYFYEAVKLVLEGIQTWHLHYADEAKRLAATEKNAKQKKEYEEIDVPAWAIKIYLDQEEMQAYKEGITDEH